MQIQPQKAAKQASLDLVILRRMPLGVGLTNPEEVVHGLLMVQLAQRVLLVVKDGLIF